MFKKLTLRDEIEIDPDEDGENYTNESHIREIYL